MSGLEAVPANTKALVVDDFSTMRKILKGILRQVGISRVVEASDGAEALEKLKEGGVTLILSDWSMPNMMGGELLRALRESADYREIPVLMIASRNEMSEVAAVSEHGAEYIIKPFTAELLKEKLAHLFG
jgi:two-component system, chemotaxis family, chemotaxis protein CheY